MLCLHANLATYILPVEAVSCIYGSSLWVNLQTLFNNKRAAIIAANLPTSEVRPRVTVAQGTSLAASARAYHLPVGSSCLPLSAQYGAALPHRPAPTGEQRWLPAASMLVVVGQARCPSYRTRDHRWPCVQFNCSSCVEQSANGSAVFWVTGHFSTSPDWKLNCSRVLTTNTAPVKRLYCCVTHFHFPTAFCCGRNLEVYRL